MGNETPLLQPNGLYPTLCGIALVCALDSDTHAAHSGGPVFFGMADPSHDASFHSTLCGSKAVEIRNPQRKHMQCENGGGLHTRLKETHPQFQWDALIDEPSPITIEFGPSS